MRVLSTLAIRAGLLVVTLPKCAKWLIGDSFLFRSEMCESRSPQGERETTCSRGRGEHQAGLRAVGDERAGLVPQAAFRRGDAVAGMDELAFAPDEARVGEDGAHETHVQIHGGVGLPGIHDRM